MLYDKSYPEIMKKKIPRIKVFAYFSPRKLLKKFSHKMLLESSMNCTAKRVSVFRVFLASISPCSVRMQEKTDQKISQYGHFLRSADYQKSIFKK